MTDRAALASAVQPMLDVHHGDWRRDEDAPIVQWTCARCRSRLVAVWVVEGTASVACRCIPPEQLAAWIAHFYPSEAFEDYATSRDESLDAVREMVER